MQGQLLVHSGTAPGGADTADGAAAGAARVSPPRVITAPRREAVQELLRSDSHWWLDLTAVDAEVLDLLLDDCGFHPLAVEDVEQFRQRPKIENYDDFALIVVYDAPEIGGPTGPAHGATDGPMRSEPTEIHCFVTERFVITIHRAPVRGIQLVQQRAQRERALSADPAMVLHRVVDAVVDDYFPSLEAFDDHIDELQDNILQRPTDAQLGTLFELKRALITFRRLASEQRDMFAAVLAGTHDIPGMSSDSERYFRDLYDHLARIGQTADSYRDLLSSALDTYLSVTSNRLNVVMKQLTIIATVFLPMTFLTGFFGQNFGWLVSRIGGSGAFWALAVALPIVVAAGLLWMFRLMGWWGGNAADQADRAARKSLRRRATQSPPVVKSR